MKSKKVAVISMAITFAFVVILSCFFAFSINEVRADFKEVKNCDTEKVQSVLNTFKGQSLIFCNLSSIETKVEEGPYLEVESISKAFPNVVDITIRERHETFAINVDGDDEVENNIFILSEDGYLLRKLDKQSGVADNELIPMTLNSVKLKSAVLGEKISTDNDDVLYMVLGKVKTLGFSNLVTSVDINFAVYYPKISVVMKSGVKILVRPTDEKMKSLTATTGLFAYQILAEMLDEGFDCYMERLSDYEKTTGCLGVVVDSGKIKSLWPFKEAE